MAPMSMEPVPPSAMPSVSMTMLLECWEALQRPALAVAVCRSALLHSVLISPMLPSVAVGLSAAVLRLAMSQALFDLLVVPPVAASVVAHLSAGPSCHYCLLTSGMPW